MLPSIYNLLVGDIVTVERNKSNTLSAVEELRDLIFSGELPADSNHLESDLADMLGMSRTPVREASLMLAGQGLLEVQPRKGVRISSISINDMSEIYEALTELESLAARRAAEAGYSPQELTALNGHISDMESAIGEGDRQNWSVSDEAFHNELVRLGGNSHVQRIVHNFNDRVRRARNLTLHIRPLPVKSNTDHRALYDAILKGDAERAHTIHRHHRTYARKLLIDLLKQHGFRRV